jgi:hypothetical protein
MTLYVNLRAGPYGAVCSPYVLEGDGLVVPPTLTAVDWSAVPCRVRGKRVLLATHGFNVSYESGVCSLAQLEQALSMQPDELLLGVLWPGDWAIPAINYPVEDGIASHAGRLLGGFCNQWLKSAQSISVLSHSLGARVVLETIKASTRPIQRACITAGAINFACLREEFAAAATNCDQILTLSSRQDLVLEFAYPPGDLAADILDPDHPPFEPALGRGGPAAPWGPAVLPYEIPDADGYDHGDYFPPGTIAAAPPPLPSKWVQAARFMAAAFRGATPPWP